MCKMSKKICEHGRVTYYCKQCGGSGICEHNRRRQQCIDCGGSGVCEHKKRRYRCIDCKGSGICEHNKIKDSCVECGGSQLCKHNRRKDKCIDCEGSGVCQHKRRKNECKECGGSQICEHGRLKQTCKECGGACVCDHGRLRTHCRECKGGTICQHDKRRSRCKECRGGSICQHNKERNYCPECKGKYICKTDGCDSYANRKYNGYCMRCCIYLHPDIPIVKNYKTKEKTVVDLVCEKYPDFTWIKDKRVQDGCSMRRPDLLLDLGEQVVVIEIDENQHEDYNCSCENKRLMEISRDICHRPLIFIRFNPDEYETRDKKVVKSCWYRGKDGIIRISKNELGNWNKRINILYENIDYWIENRTDKTIEVIQLFYDMFD